MNPLLEQLKSRFASLDQTFSPILDSGSAC